MPYLKYEGHEVFARDGESVLDAFLRQGVSIPFSCRNGSCHVCLQQNISGDIPPVAQQGLRPELCEEGYFLACQCIPLGDMEIAPPNALYRATAIYSKEMLSANVCRLLIEPPQGFDFHPGQFINLRRHDGLTRSYSLAGLPQDYFLELHVQRKKGGAMSNWILDELQAGDEIRIQGPDGDCYYQAEAHHHPLLMVATGTGLAPLLGILHNALQQQHTADIHLYHGSHQQEGLYLDQHLRELEQQHPNFRYHPCISGDIVPKGSHAGRAHDIAFAQHKDLREYRVYLAGLAAMVDSGEQLAAERGASPHAIHSDAFLLRDLRGAQRDNTSRAKTNPAPGNERQYPPPDPELWAALHNGELLMEVLRDFYGRVFQDPKLSSFFHGVTRQRAIEKQFLFTRQILTGEKIYFGDRPRNAHHWMVISDDLFDYREEMMMTCLREHGLAESMVHRFREVEEFFRRDIVKAAPFARMMGDVELPFEGFNEITMDVGTLCDSCEREVSAGEKVVYHVRLGKIYCSECSAQRSTA